MAVAGGGSSGLSGGGVPISILDVDSVIPILILKRAELALALALALVLGLAVRLVSFSLRPLLVAAAVLVVAAGGTSQRDCFLTLVPTVIEVEVEVEVELGVKAVLTDDD
jgi:hypothetical protein